MSEPFKQNSFLDITFGEEPVEIIDLVGDDEEESIEERWIPVGLSCPECGVSLKLKNVNLEDKKDKRKAWFCGYGCGRQSYDEYGRR